MANVTQFNRNNAGEAILLDIQGLQDALQCGRGTALKIAKEADAEIRIRKIKGNIHAGQNNDQSL